MRRSLFLVFTLVTSFCYSQNTSQYSLLKRINLSGESKWDYSTIDETSNRLFVSNFDRVHVIDLTTDKEILEIKGLSGVHGITLAKELKKGYITNGGNSTVTVFDYNQLKVVATIAIDGKKADAILYDKFSNNVFVFCNGTGNVIVINAKTDKVIGNIKVDGAPEFAVTNNKGNIFNNNEDTNEITEIDAKSLSVKNHFSLLPNEVATGLAFDVKNNRLFSGCRKSKSLVVVNATNGAIVQTLPIGSGVDAVVYDPLLKLVMSSNGEGNVSIFKQESKDKYAALQTLATSKGSRTMALWQKTHQIYLSSTEYEADGKTIKPNSFGILVYGINKK